jgi:GT2 family glycosyltransferase
MNSVGVVVPCYRYGHFLADCVSSLVENQPGVDVRVLIIDDASPDDSAERARELARSDPRVEVRAHTENRGHIRTYNEGLMEWADTDYVTLVSADDLVTPGALTRAVEFLDAHPSVGFVYGHPIHFDPADPLPPARTRGRGCTVWPGHRWVAGRFRQAHNVITTPEVVVRTSVQRRAGGYREDLPHAGDLELWMRLASHADVGYLKGVDQAYYRVHGQNMSRTVFGAHLTDLVQRRDAFLAVLRTCDLPDPQGLHRMVSRRLAHEAVWRASRAYDRRRTDTVPIAELLDFARTTYPAITRSAVYTGYRMRRSVGPRTMPYLQPLIWTALASHARDRLWWASWRRHGV